jgi:uncharacterized protein (DUF4415 family)
MTTNEQKKRVRKLAKMPDDKIDFSDIPEIKTLPEDYVIGKFYQPRNVQVTIEIDAQVVAWLKRSGDIGEQFNSYLKEKMYVSNPHICRKP